MTVAELIAQLQTFSPNARVTLKDPDTEWLLKIRLENIPASNTSRGVDFVAITSDYGEDEE